MIVFALMDREMIPVLGGIAGLLLVGVVVLYLFRGYEALARRALARRYAGLQVHETPAPGDVTLSYETYHGLVAWFTQTSHRVSMPPGDARILLGRLMRFNLTWGLVTYGALFVLPLALVNYFAQRRSISGQESNNAFAVTPVSESLGVAEGNPYAPPQTTSSIATPSRSFYYVIGWICAFICFAGGIGTFQCLMRRDFETAIGVLLVTAFFGWTAWDWIHGRRLP
jgi:hypothetical protein